MKSIFLFLIDCSLPKLYSATFSFLILMVYCWWFFAYKPLQNTIDSYTSQIKLLPDQTNVSKASKKRCRILAQELKSKKAEIIETHSNKQSKELYCSVEGVIRSIAKNNLLLQNYVPDKHSKKNGESPSFSFFLLGDFYQYMNLFESLDINTVYCKKCVLKKIDETTVSCHLSLIL